LLFTGDIDSELEDDLAAFSGKKVANKIETDFEIFLFSENIEAFEIFIQVRTQFNFAGMGSVIGLNYQSVEFVMNLYDVEDKLDCFRRIRIIENEALILMREKGNGTAT